MATEFQEAAQRLGRLLRLRSSGHGARFYAVVAHDILGQDHTAPGSASPPNRATPTASWTSAPCWPAKTSESAARAARLAARAADSRRPESLTTTSLPQHRPRPRAYLWSTYHFSWHFLPPLAG